MSGTPNRLIQETSPYLLQHAYNPVHWYPWCEEALAIAKKENKPILVSIGYAACHWCHVMERESFENEETAAIMNAHFVNIKIDREERPDLDHVYMDAVQTMTGSGGWPLNVFLTPDGKPFYGGTYFPPERAYNRASWKEVLAGVQNAWSEKQDEVIEQANSLLAHLEQANNFGRAGVASRSNRSDQEKQAGESTHKDSAGKTESSIVDDHSSGLVGVNSFETGLFSRESLQTIANNSLAIADKQWGGFGKAPKFPQSFTVLYLLRYSHFTRNEPALQQALLSLDKMMLGGIYDQLGGGFARYSTDSEWLAPHFEKMLYDNALLISVYSEALQLTGNDAYRKLIEQTIEFVQRELLLPHGGFGSALDADSEGVEGKFYTWSAEEIEECLIGNRNSTSKKDSLVMDGEILLAEDRFLESEVELFKSFYDIKPQGNWEHTNILWIQKKLHPFCEERGLDPVKAEEILLRARKKLLQKRSERVRPLFDDKILLGWNALMNKACSKAYAATGHEGYRNLAVRNMQFLLEKFTADGSSELLAKGAFLKSNSFFHTYKREARFPAFLDDLAFLAEAMIQLQEITADKNWLRKAETLVLHILENFADTDSPFFFYTPVGQSDIIVRKKELYDGALPSGNSVMASVLHHLFLLLDRPEWGQRSREMISALGEISISHPISFGNWNCLLQEMVLGTNEVALMGPAVLSLQKEFLAAYIPHRVLMISELTDDSFPLLKSKTIDSVPAFWLCKNFACLPPIASVPELIALISKSEGR